jgi:hypothetical protein
MSITSDPATEAQESGAASAAGRPSGGGQRKGRPVLYWAAFGTACTALLTYVFAAWMLSDDFRPTPTGPDQLSQRELVGMWLLQILFPLMAAVVTATIVRRCVRERRFVWDAKLQIGCVLMFWLDPVPNFLQPQVLFNSHYVNFGSWVTQIPGWISPRGHNLPNSLLVELPIFFLLILGVWVGCAVMKLLEARFPRINTFGLLFGAWAWMSVFTMLLEYPLIRLGWLAWNGTIHALSIDGGDRMQMPLTECWLVGAWLTMLSGLRYFRGEDGVSVVERGLDRVRAGNGARQALSLLAVIGFAQLSFMAYNAFTIPLALYDDATPTGYPSYIYNQMCGPGTPYPCTGPGASIILPKPEH